MGKIAVAVIVSSWVIPISILVNRIVPDPYMDEIFHVPQAQQYCKGNFLSWDPMITTPPGLYLISLAHVASLFPGLLCARPALHFSDACSTSVLRSTNGFMSVICSIVIYEIITFLRPSLDERKATLYAVVIALYPLHWFFSFFYYTDVASLTFVLAMYLLALKRSYLFSALLGAAAVIHRQTNIIWILFVACAGVIDCAQANQKDKVQSDTSELEDDQFGFNRSVSIGSNLKKRRQGNAANHSRHQTTAPSLSQSSGMFSEILEIVLILWQLKRKLLVSFSPFFVTLVAFVIFVHWNGSVVLGAKEAHTVSPHLAQFFYFSLVSALFMAPVHFTPNQVVTLACSCWKKRPLSLLLLFLALGAGFLSVHYFSIAHPYLLADNRHYPFYLWRRIIKAHWTMKYLLVPLYVYSWFSITNVLVKVQKQIWVLALVLASAAVLIPAPLIEFRYYTIPFFFVALHSHVSDDRSWIMMGLLYTIINVFTMIMFLFRPFHWDHEAGLQRFIW